MKYEVRVNGRVRSVDVASDTPMLWVLREQLGLTGTKFGCGVGACRACTIHVDDRAQPSCLLPVSAVGDRQVVTIEGLSKDNSHPVQRAWLDEQVPQCGYCQPGIIMTVAALLGTTAKPDDATLDAAILNLCRCGTYNRVRAAIRRAIT